MSIWSIFILIIISLLLVLMFLSMIVFVYNIIKIRVVSKFKYADDTDKYDYPFILPNILTEDQCLQIIQYSSKKLTDSMVVGGMDKSIRKSKQTWIEKTNPMVKPIYEYLTKTYNIPIENAEDLQVVRYLPNEFYNEHHDSCCDDVQECHDFVKRGGQRKLTVVIYLNNDFKGGETYFKNLDKKYKPSTGSAIVFYPLAKDSNLCHPKALHAGLPVKSGEKWIANVWFRENTFI